MLALTTYVQEGLLTLLVFGSEDGAHRIVSSALTQNSFDVYYREIFQASKSYLTEFEEPPGEHFLDLIEALCSKNEKARKNYESLASSIESNRGQLNEKFLLKQMGAFTRHRKLRIGIEEALDHLESDTAEGVEQAAMLMSESAKAPTASFEAGTYLSEGVGCIDRESAEVFPMGIELLDKRGVGPARGELFVLAAHYGKGKSWGLIHFSRMALQTGRRVLYVTLEMGEDVVIKRLMMNLYAMSSRKLKKVRVPLFERDTRGSFCGFDEDLLEDTMALPTSEAKKKLRTELPRLRAPLIVKQFPTGELTLDGLRAYLEALEVNEKFVPDMIVVDYADDMKTDERFLRQSLANLYRGLRAIAIEKNLAMVTASQRNASDYREQKGGGGDTAEGFGKNFVADMVAIYSQTDSEYDLGFARLYFDKVRGEQGKMTLVISQNYAIGQFVLDAVRLNTNYKDAIETDEEAWKDV